MQLKITVDDFNNIIVKEIMYEQTTGEKISELLSYGHQVFFKSDDTEPVIILAEAENSFIFCNQDFSSEDSCYKEGFDDEENSVIRIWNRKLKKLKEGEKVIKLVEMQKTEILDVIHAEDLDIYDTEFGELHISNLAPSWYAQRETIEIGGRRYDKREFEEAVKDLREI